MNALLHAGRFWAKLWAKILVVVVVLLIAARIALPYVVKHVINKELASLDGYWGHVEDVDIHLWRGAYALRDIKILKSNGKIRTPFFSAYSLEFQVDWYALFDGRIVAEGDLWRPRLNFVSGPTEATSQDGTEADWRSAMDNIVPLDINRFSVHQGAVHYRDFHASPKVNVFISGVDASVWNLRNTKELKADMPSRFMVSGVAMRSGKVRVRGRVNVMSPKPRLMIDFALRGLELKQVNNFLKAYVGVDAEAGTASLYSEVRIADGRIKGFAKPIFDHVTLFRWSEGGGFLDKLGDLLAEIGLFILTNHKYDRFATKIPISGDVDAPDPDVWATIGGVLRNEFIKVFSHGLGPTAEAKGKGNDKPKD